MAFVVLLPVSANDPVQASRANQELENITRVRNGELKLPYGNANDFMGFKLIRLPGPPVQLVWYAKNNTEPENITYDNAEQILDLQVKDPSSSELGF